jgi:hypothetical protein
MASWQCVACSSELTLPARVGRRDVCPGCGAELRSCRQCAFYDPSSYNSCREPQAERVLAKERANFCEYFQPATSPRAAAAAPDARPGPAARGTPNAQRTPDARAQLDALFRKR